MKLLYHKSRDFSALACISLGCGLRFQNSVLMGAIFLIYFSDGKLPSNFLDIIYIEEANTSSVSAYIETIYSIYDHGSRLLKGSMDYGQKSI